MEGLTEELGRNFRFPHKPYFCLRGNENTRAALYHNIREFTARVLVAASSCMRLLSVPEPIQA
ncbi:MAG: hypothetical protein VYE28_12490 [Planctomycetota bacterium]|nr:hypothetical protein [Planctomycetota bacterium]